MVTNDNPPVRVGIDAGSKTLKLVALDEAGDVVFSEYHRHRSDVRTALAEMLHEIIWRYGDMSLPVSITGSAGIALAQALDLPFVQEVVAATNAVRARYPQADCVIELGGEDAKITYLTGTPEYRMNATCAGGTGDFIDGIAGMLGCKTREISRLALGHQRTYPIASRCAVFAQTDVRPLINAGANRADIAQSALEAVVRQTLGGLACGRPIRGTVVFLGGPLEHIPALVMAFRRKLGLNAQTGIKPPDAHLYTAMGAAETVENPPVVSFSELEKRARGLDCIERDAELLDPLFEGERDYEEFLRGHKAESVPVARLENAAGPLFLGFDAGSTTCKYVIVDEAGSIVSSDYRAVEGDSFDTARMMFEELLLGVEGGRYSRGKRFIARAVVTGYGEDLLRVGLGFDDGVVETVAHLRAARHFQPDLTFMLDIGGQDMKALWVRDGQVVDAVLNEACSSGCGAFIRSSAKSLNHSQEEFSRVALQARHPIDLGAKCTVFMTSRVRHAQKSGAQVGDIAAGIAYSVVNNAITRIIGEDRAAALGDKVVVQGGTFKSDAVLRAFEKVTGVHAIRPNEAHLMGAYGCALIARDSWMTQGSEVRESAAHERGVPGVSSVVGLDEIRALHLKRRTTRCTGCGNACLLSVVEFGNGRRFVSGNRCERYAQAVFGDEGETGSAESAGGNAPNVVKLEQRLISAFRDKKGKDARGSTTIGLMNVLNLYESMPFWHTLITRLGFSVIVPDDSRSQGVQDASAETIPSESVCHPAKLAHLRYAYLIRAGVDIVFMPRFERGTRCPVSCCYADVLATNAAGDARLSRPTVRSIRPKRLAGEDIDRKVLLEEFNTWTQAGDFITEEEFERAFALALAAQDEFDEQLGEAAGRAFAWAREDSSRRVAIIVGRPYHADPALLHEIDTGLAKLGIAVVPPRAVPATAGVDAQRAFAGEARDGAALFAQKGGEGGVSGGKPLWKPAKHLVKLVRAYAADPQVEIVALRSFGCGYDAVSFDEARDVAMALRRPFTELKIDDIADTAHIRIRLRTLAYTTQEHEATCACHEAHASRRKRVVSMAKSGWESSSADKTPPAVPEPAARSLSAGTITPDLCSTAKELVRLACNAIDGAPGSTRLVVPAICRDCLTDALPFELKHLLRPVEMIETCGVELQEPWFPKIQVQAGEVSGGMKVGLLGNPLIVFNPSLNDHVEDLLHELGCEVVFPDPRLIDVEDVRYVDQLRAFSEAGVKRVIYLQSFGCLKGHVQSRGALRELEQRFPALSITVVDYDPESSSLNRENRIRLAVSGIL